MSRSAKWKFEKTKVKVVFRLQFNATHIPQTGWNNLFISLIPADSGKASAKTNKTTVRNGTCKWADPIYETTRLLQDAKTKQYEEKLYKLIVAMGTSRSSILGEASINLSDFVDALKPTVLALPLQGSDAGAILNVTVQLLTSKTGFREFEQQREVSDRGLPPNPDHDSGKLSIHGDAVISRTDKVSAKVKFKPLAKELPSLEEESGFSEEYADSTAGFDGSSNTSDSIYAEKHEISGSRENKSVKNTVSGDVGGISPAFHSPSTENESSDHHFLVQNKAEWVNRWGAENSADNEIALVCEENSQLRSALEVADRSIHELRQEILSLQRHSDDLSVETQKLTEHLTVEITSGLELTKEVSLLKSESLRFKGDLEWLRNIKMNHLIPRPKITDADQCNLLQDLSVKWLKGLSIVEDKIAEVQNKVQLGHLGKDSMVLCLDLGAVLGIVQNLKQGTEHSVYDISASKTTPRTIEMDSAKADPIMSDTGLGVEPCDPEGVLLTGFLAHGAGSVDATNAMQGEIFKLLRELDESKAERENLVRKMDQMECYYEALIQELEENQKQILGELQNLRNEHSSCIYTISSTKAQMEAMHQQMNDELLQLASERCELDAVNKELERRAVSSEAALRRARLNYSIAVNQVQKDLEMLSLQVVSMYETNENLIRKAFEENAAKVSDNDKLMPSQTHNIGIKNQLTSGGDRLLEDLRKSLKLQKDLYEKIQEELSDIHLANVNLDVFSVMLHQALLEAVSDRRLVENEMHEYAKHLEISLKSNESLRLKLQNIMDEKLSLSEEKDDYVSKCNNLASQNMVLKADLRRYSDEKVILNEKVGELESQLTVCRSYESKYKDCHADKAKSENLLELAASENGHLSDEILSLQGRLSYLQRRLESLLESEYEQIGVVPSCHVAEDTNTESSELASIVSRLEQLHSNFNSKILRLMKDNADLLEERDVAQLSLASANSEAEIVKRKYQCDMPNMVGRLNGSTELVEKLQRDLEVIGNRVMVSSEAEENYARMTEDLCADFAKMEAALQELASKNMDLTEELNALGSVSDELEKNKLDIDKLMQENFNLVTLLESKSKETDHLSLELSDLRLIERRLHDELSVERDLRQKVEAEALNLQSRVKQFDEKFSHLDQNNTELCQLKRQLLDVESEKLSISSQLSELEVFTKKAQEEYSNLDIQLHDMHGLLIAADVTSTTVTNQYRCHVEELLQKLEYSDQDLRVANEKNAVLLTKLTNCLTSEATYAQENAQLLSKLETLQSESEALVSLNVNLEHANSDIAAELEECKKRSESLKFLYSKAETEIDNVILLKEDLEIRLFVLQAKLDDANDERNLLSEEYGTQLTKLQKQCSELSRKLSEQILKTEEFKNLSIHLKELKDKADAQEKRETEGSSVAMQESLRIAFIKEQYETKLQELRHQLSISKKHGEEMLWKLQDALDELEKRRKSEASLSKRNEELLSKISELEGELQSVLSDNRERLMAYDQLKAELDCSVMSLDCCNDEKSRLADEVELMREQLDNLKAFMRSPERKVQVRDVAEKHMNDPVRGDNHVDESLPRTSCLTNTVNGGVNPDQGTTLVANSAREISAVTNGQNELLQDDPRHVAVLSDQSKAQTLLSSMDRLHKELEKMKSENMAVPGDEDAVDQYTSQGLRIDQTHLDKVAKELENMSSLYNDSSRSGNSIERVLALELELAEALQSKKKSTIQFQSSFLKLHSDEAAVFQSFRDINELIKEMLEMKGRHGAMESELKEMHERYSQLSLQFAEVEGERQKLTMMLKNARSSKRLFSRSPSSSPVESS